MGNEASSCCQGANGVSKDEETRIASSVTGTEEAAIRDDDGMAEEDNVRMMAKMKGAGRRQGVAAEAMSAMDMKEYKKKVYPKDAATMERIKSIIKGDDKLQVLFGHLDMSSVEEAVDAFQEVTANLGEDIIRQGDQGDCLYIINEGTVDVYVARPGPDGHVKAGDKGSLVVSLGAGALFGELALMYSAPRAATVSITSPVCKLWKLDREPFKMLIVQQSQSQYQLYEGWLSDIDILKSLNHYELSRLSELLDSTPYDAGEEIIKQGEPGDKFYILEDGTCAAFIVGSQGERKVKTYDKKGDYFGEIALMNDEPRKATVRATGQGALVLSLSKEDFTSVLGPIQDILRKDVEKYPQYAHFLN